MNGSRIVAACVAAAGALTLVACPPRVKVDTRPPETGAAVEGVEITSQLSATVAGGGRANLTLVGVAAHTRTGVNVIFTAKQLVAIDPSLGPVTVTLNPAHRSTGTLESETFPTRHRQDFFLRIQNERLGTLVSDAPLTLSARIQSSPPTAKYESTSGDVAFFKEGDPARQPVLTVHGVSSEVKPAARTSVEITSRVTVAMQNRQIDLVVVGPATHIRRGTSVIFIAKRLVAQAPPIEVGPLVFTLDPQGQSLGTLGAETMPAEHLQSFALRIESERLGTLVADTPVTVAARIDRTPPTATYKLVGGPVAFHREGDRMPVLTLEGLESDVRPAEGYE